MRRTTLELEYRGDRKLVTLNVYSPDEYHAERTQHGIRVPYEKLEDRSDDAIQPRGFVKDEPETQGIDLHVVTLDEMLIAHEVGHIFGLHHPNIKGSWKQREFWASLATACFDAAKKGFPVSAWTGLLRWHDPEKLRPLARKLIRSLPDA